MQTYRLYDNNPDTRTLADIADAVRNGGVIIYPTGTEYVIGCDALNAKAIERVYRYRKEEQKQGALTIVCKDISQASGYVRISKEQFKQMHQCQSEAVTFILEAGTKLPKAFRSRKTVEVRITNNSILQALLEELDHPLLAAALETPEDADEADTASFKTDPLLIEDTYRHQADIFIDGGDGKAMPTEAIDLCNNSYSD